MIAVKISREMIRREVASLLANILGMSLFKVEPCCSVQIKYNKENDWDELTIEYGDYSVESDIETDAANWSIDDYVEKILRPMVKNMAKEIEKDKPMTTDQAIAAARSKAHAEKDLVTSNNYLFGRLTCGACGHPIPKRPVKDPLLQTYLRHSND